MGTIIKLVVLLLIGVMVYRLFHRLLFGSGNAGLTEIELKPCAFCGSHIDPANGVKKQGQVFCSAEHVQAYQSRNTSG